MYVNKGGCQWLATKHMPWLKWSHLPSIALVVYDLLWSDIPNMAIASNTSSICHDDIGSCNLGPFDTAAQH